MRNRTDYERAFALVREVIHQWDPYDLMSGGAPKSEFDNEIARILTYIPKIKTESDAAQAISEVFTTAFEPKGFSLSDCAEVGRRLFASLTALD